MLCKVWLYNWYWQEVAMYNASGFCLQTLRKGATDQEKEEFLKEALLMSNFKHEHILRLLGVCLDNDPQFIILELMEGGDLLSYLRLSRPTPVSHLLSHTSHKTSTCHEHPGAMCPT